MTLSEISRYWAAKKLTTVELDKNKILFSAPFSSKEFTVRIDRKIKSAELILNNDRTSLQLSTNFQEISNGTYFTHKNETILCFTLPKGNSEIVLS
jgi:hypothetical protein